jgi:hypothetical protein
MVHETDVFSFKKAKVLSQLITHHARPAHNFDVLSPYWFQANMLHSGASEHFREGDDAMKVWHELLMETSSATVPIENIILF